MARLFVFYWLQIAFYAFLFKRFFWEKSFFYEIIVFEIGSLLFYLVLNGFKYTVHFLEFATLSNMYTFKNRLFLYSDLIIHLSKIIFQLVCLVRFTILYNYPIFWARDIFLSVLISFEYIKNYLHSMRMVNRIDR